VVVPAYCRSASGRVFRVLRSSQLIAPDRVRFALRAQPIRADNDAADLELARELDADLIRDKILNRQAIPTPETTFEDLWQQLRIDLEARDA
jgi:alkanesulfonate monooxygenase SsuD/methylene tetrahydromethanopterin reductase-like flavin-dependent oxidoreductase (luciferase family)